MNTLTGENEKVEVDIQYYTPTAEEMKNNPAACYKMEFEERKINGRIWGCSDKLRGFKPADDVITETDEIGRTYITGRIIKETDAEGQEHTTVVSTEKIAVPVMKYFTKVVSYREVIITEQEGKTNIFVSNAMDEDHVAVKYLDTLINYVGKEEVDRISKDVGASFEKMHGKIIPFRPEKMGYPKEPNGKPAVVKHAKVLQDNSPELHRQYMLYFTHIFNCLYNQAA